MKNKAKLRETTLEAEGHILDAICFVSEIKGDKKKLENITNILYLACSELTSLRLSGSIEQYNKTK